MTPAAEILRDEIRSRGPVSFRRFMDTALYHPEAGYYRRHRDPFGREGDFYTAEQVQPVFGILVAAYLHKLHEQMGAPDDFTVVELGAGRREMAEAFSTWNYVPVEVDHGALPERFRGVVFSNEFFDALPVDVAAFTGGIFREQKVGIVAGRFAWIPGEPAGEDLDRYLRRFFPAPEEGRIYEANIAALGWLDRIAASLEAGYMLTIDYGYTRDESVRFPLGTLMGYHRHIARDEVLDAPGERDITAHVNFTALREHGASVGLTTERFETLAQTLLAAGEPDQFAAALAGANEAEQIRRRMQLKTLLFGMGETFRTLLGKRA